MQRLGSLTSKKVYFAMVVGVALSVVLLFTVAYLGDQWLRKSSAELHDVRLQSRLVDEQQIALVQANKDIKKYEQLEQIANAVVPQDKDQARAVREIVKLAGEAEIPLSSITFPSSNLGSTSKPKATKKKSSSKTPAKKLDTAPKVTQVQPVNGISGVYAMEIKIQSDSGTPIPYNSLLNFLEKLENNRRTSQVSSINIKPEKDSPSLITFLLTINVYIKP
ncbi:hypothetical protein CR970_00195 [Candidatus Saccharibacteria bacterium]|nr:MAG: hypothetical protein CR970_00195 [Candidatus Saccharibacteria bacterium]